MRKAQAACGPGWLFSSNDTASRGAGPRRGKGGPQNTGDGKMLAVETSKGKPVGTQARRGSPGATLLPAPTPTRARHRVHLSRGNGPSSRWAWCVVLFTFFVCLFIIYHRLKFGKNPAQTRSSGESVQGRGEAPSRCAPTFRPGLQLGKGRSWPSVSQPLATSPEFEKNPDCSEMKREAGRGVAERGRREGERRGFLFSSLTMQRSEGLAQRGAPGVGWKRKISPRG